MFVIDLKPVSEGQLLHVLEYTWAEPVTVAEIFVLLSEQSTKSVPLYMKMIDTEQECVFDRPYLDTGYLSCFPAIAGSKLHISLLTSQDEPQLVSIAGLNIYSSYNLITQTESPLTI